MKHRNRGQRRMKYKFRINGKPGGVVASESERLRNGIIPGTMNCTANCENPPFELRCIVRIREQRDISAQRSLWRAPENTISLSLCLSPSSPALYLTKEKYLSSRGGNVRSKSINEKERDFFSSPSYLTFSQIYLGKSYSCWKKRNSSQLRSFSRKRS